MNEGKTFDALLTHLPTMMDWIRSHLKHLPFTNSEKNKLEVACEEILVNIISYAYSERPGLIEMFWNEKNGFFSLTFKDHGKPFNPLNHQKPLNKNTPLEGREIGGLGIYFIRQFVDKVDYTFLDGTNILTISKRIRLRKAI